MLPGEREDLIHEATGSMLRAVSKRDGPVAEAFLRRHLPDLPRMMPRYASEAYPPELRERYLREDV